LSRRRLLPALSALWLVGAFVGIAVVSGIFGLAAAAVRLLIAAAVVGSGAFIVTGWAMVATENVRRRRQPASAPARLTLDDLQAMSPGEFETWVQQLFRSRGYFTTNTPDGADHGIDLWVVSPQGERAIVQCKRYRGVVGEPVVRDLYGVMQHEAAARGFLVTTGGISAAAGRWAQGKPIDLIDGPRLAMLAAGQVDPAEPLAGVAWAGND
jgi:restriction system protein